jgi:cobalt/nickel transport system permease protein
MRFFDELGQKDTFVHSIHPLVKLIVTLLYIVVVVSGEKYSVGRLLPLALYPFVMIPLAEIPFSAMAKRTLIVLPLIIGLGIFNPVFDKNIIMISDNIRINAGWISFCTLVLKSVLTVLAALILFATTGIERIGFALRLLRVPRLFVLQLLLTFRYISLFNTMISRTMQAYSLRAPEHRGIAPAAWGPLAGQLLLRSFDTAQRVYDAMILRGFEGEYHPGGVARFGFRDIIFAIVCIAFCLVVNFIDIPSVIGGIVSGG